MIKKKGKPIVDTGFVPGIYNYCDRWCERCKFQSKCMSYTMRKKVRERTKANFKEELSDDTDAVFARLKHIFDSTFQVLRELAEERGVAIEDIYRAENIYKGYWGEDYEDLEGEDEEVTAKVTNEDVEKCSRIYDSLVNPCIDRIYNKLKKNKKLKTPEVDNALQEVSWYVDLIHPKVKRALYGYHICTKKLTNATQAENDFKGSAKVAILSMEISWNAWLVLKDKLSFFERDISHILVVLELMLSDIKRHFPTAMEFKRPGLDE